MERHKWLSQEAILAIPLGGFDRSRRPRMVRQFGGPRSLALEPRQDALVQDLPPCRAEFGVDHLAQQLMGEALAAQAAHPRLLLAQDPPLDRLLQGLDPGLHFHLGQLPQQLCARRSSQHGTDLHQVACGS